MFFHSHVCTGISGGGGGWGGGACMTILQLWNNCSNPSTVCTSHWRTNLTVMSDCTEPPHLMHDLKAPQHGRTLHYAERSSFGDDPSVEHTVSVAPVSPIFQTSQLETTLSVYSARRAGCRQCQHGSHPCRSHPDPAFFNGKHTPLGLSGIFFFLNEKDQAYIVRL